MSVIDSTGQYRSLCEEQEQAREAAKEAYEEALTKAQSDFDFERAAGWISDGTPQSTQRAIEARDVRISTAFNAISIIESSYKTDLAEQAMLDLIKREELETAIRRKEQDLSDTVNKKINLESQRISVLEEYLKISREDISNFRYATYCNFLVATIIEEHSRKYTTSSDDNLINLRVGDLGQERTANDMYEYLKEDFENWDEISAREANSIANSIGAPVVASWKNERGNHGHVGVVYPGYIPKGNFDEGSINLYAAGRHAPGKTTINESFGSKKIDKIKYFALKKDYEEYKNAISSLNINRMVEEIE